MSFQGLRPADGEAPSPYLAIPRTQLEILKDIALERRRQNMQWGANQRHPDGTSREYDGNAYRAKHLEQTAAALGKTNWQLILDEEVSEAYAETDPVKLEEELIQSAAVIVAWIEDIRSR